MLALIHAQRQQLTALTAQLVALAAERRPDDRRQPRQCYGRGPMLTDEEASSSNEEPEEDAPPRRQRRQRQQQLVRVDWKRLQRYDGTTSFRQWIDRFELIADQQGIPSRERCSVALQLMDGAAKKVTDNDLFFTRSWATCSAIMANYFEEDNEAIALSALYSLEMGKNESVMEFIPRFRAVIPRNYTEHQRIQAFISKLPVNLRSSRSSRSSCAGG
ncbi:hypothetical protein QOT17_012625 [Balamuthia mandrillaris]